MQWGFFEVFAAGLAGFYGFAKSYGLAIILLTLLVRVILLPLSIKQTRSMREMAVIQPEVKRLQAKYKGDRQKMNEEMMKLYKEHGVNPFGGCLPLLMQFPVLIALFYVIRAPLNYMSENWALADDLTNKALAVNRFIGLRLDCFPSNVLNGQSTDAIPGVACGSGFVSFLPYALLILVMGFTTYYQQKQMQASRGAQDSPQAQQMQMFTRIMPFMLMFFAFNFPTGVVIYWVTTNLWTIVQQRIILKAAPIPAAPAGGGGKAKPKTESAKPKGKQEQSKTKPQGAAKQKPATGATPEDGSPPPKSRPHPSSKKKRR